MQAYKCKYPYAPRLGRAARASDPGRRPRSVGSRHRVGLGTGRPDLGQRGPCGPGGGDATLAEAAAICAYVAERYPEAKLAPPVGDIRRAKYLYWLFFSPGCIEPAIVQLATKIEMNPVAAGWGEAQRVFDVLDAAVSKGPWILGDTFSAADIVIGSGLNFAVRMFKMVPPRPSFDAYLDRCAARPAFQRAEKIAAG